jgi:hypothetical protein
MPGIKRKRCRHCNTLFIPDHEIGTDKITVVYLSAEMPARLPVRKMARKTRQPDYFRGSGKCANGFNAGERTTLDTGNENPNHPEPLQDPLNPTTC